MITVFFDRKSPGRCFNALTWSQYDANIQGNGLPGVEQGAVDMMTVDKDAEAAVWMS